MGIYLCRSNYIRFICEILIHNMGVLNKDAQIFLKSISHLKILCAGRMTYAEDPKMVCASIQNLRHHGGMVPGSCAPLA